MGILNTLETIVTVMEDQKDILQHIEGIVVNVIGIILQQNVIGELFLIKAQIY